MNCKYLYYLALFLIPLPGFNQISPGKLSQAHAELEGISNCTQCHTLGDKVSNNKCLACHEDIQSLLNQDRGYHASDEVRNQDCFACHSDHHGRKFEMVRFDEAQFDHNLTGYELEGQHDKIECKDCHIADHIADASIKKRESTFLGLEEDCLSCHLDFHQNTLSNDCIQCHDFEAFRPAPLFNHEDAEFDLKGAHVNVDCLECHEKSIKNGQEFQSFTGLEFQDCNSCHEDPHLGHFKNHCFQCHNENSFESFTGFAAFNHNTTRFTLKGSHRQVACFACHQKSSNPKTVFQDKLNIKENQCASCHQDVHDNKFGNDCAQCHVEKSFLTLKTMDFFNHNVTDYPLEGKHVGVDCKSCHTNRYTEPIDFAACKNCHIDYHLGEFEDQQVSPDCSQCHSLHEGFQYSLFSLEDHAETPFPLVGSHLATPCFDCHLKEEQWTFRNIGNTCVDCHKDIHEGQLSSKYYPEQRCQSCHSEGSWASISFDHVLTEWPLEGAHAQINCRDCHFDNTQTNNEQEFSFLSIENECARCHEHLHGDQFAENGQTDCIPCHNTESWSPSIFDHNRAAYKLDGEHVDVECKACHLDYADNDVNKVIYKIEKFDCIDCHQ